MHQFLEPLESRRLMDAGQLDTTFGSGGHTEVTLSGGAETLSPVDLDAAPGGQVVVTAFSRPVSADPAGGWTLRLWSLRADGALDTSFGPAGDGSIALAMPDAISRNRIETVVTAGGGVLVEVANVLYKFQPNGRRDNSFGTRGRLIVKSMTTVQDVDADPAGLLYVVVGDADGSIALQRLNPNGSPDASFGPSGLDPAVAALAIQPTDFRVRALDDGTIGVAGVAKGTGAPGEFTFPAFDIDGLKVLANGNLDTSFGDAGRHHEERLNNDVDKFDADTIRLTRDGIFTYAQDETQDISTHFTVRGFDFGIKPFPSIDGEGVPVDFVSDGSLSLIARSGAVNFVSGSNADITAANAAAASAMGTFDPRLMTVQADGSILVLASPNPNATLDTLSVRRLFRDDAPVGQVIARTLASERNASYRFTVQWRDDDGIDVSSLGNDDVTVKFPDGTRHHARLVGTDVTSGKVVNATYLVTSADGSWTAADNGRYEVRIERRSVRDTAGNTAAQRVAGEFFVRIPAGAAPLSGSWFIPSAAIGGGIDDSPGKDVLADH